MSLCPLCENSSHQELFSFDKAFVSSGVLDELPNLAKTKTRISLVQCRNCDFIFNQSFDFEAIKKEYSSKNYISRKIVSSAMNKTIQSIKESILHHCKKALMGGGIELLEIAPGRCDLLLALARHCDSLLTIDPSNISLQSQNIPKHQHIQGFFDESIASKIRQKPNLIIFRHLLEHIEHSGEFLRQVVQLADEKALLYIEVPNAPEWLGNLRFYEIFNDHCGQYQESVLCNFMADLSCECVGKIMLYDEQHLGLFFQKRAKFKYQKQKSLSYDEGLKTLLQKRIKDFNALITSFENIALYGAGAHGNTLISFLEPKILAKIKLCFDLDDKKQDKYLQSTAIKITKPSKELLQGLDCIVLCSPLYENEIVSFLQKEGFKGKVLKSQKEPLLLDLA